MREARTHSWELSNQKLSRKKKDSAKETIRQKLNLLSTVGSNWREEMVPAGDEWAYVVQRKFFDEANKHRKQTYSQLCLKKDWPLNVLKASEEK